MSRVYTRKVTAILYSYKRKMMSSESTAHGLFPGKICMDFHSNIYRVLTVHPQCRARSVPMDATEDDKRKFRFKDSLEYFRSLSNGDQSDSAYSSTSDLVLASPELQMAQSDGTSHWNPTRLCTFINCGGDYVKLFKSQLPSLKNYGAWDPHKDNLRLASIRGFIPGASEALYLCPNTMSGMLSCSMHQSGPYLPTHVNSLEFNFVLYNKTPPYDPWNLTMSLFTPKFQHNYSLKVEEVHCSGSQCPPPPNRADVKFLCDPELHPINCLRTRNGCYNISITAYNKHTYWLYFEVVNSTAVVKAFLDDGSPNLPAKAEFDFQNILLS